MTADTVDGWVTVCVCSGGGKQFLPGTGNVVLMEEGD